MGDGGGRTLIILTPRDLFGSAQAVGRKESRTTVRSPEEKSDLLILAMKLVKASGAKGEMD